MTDCTYCGCEVEAHDPVFVYEESSEEVDGGREKDGRESDDREKDGREKDDRERVAAGRFCNYGCLSAHVEESGLADGTRCRLDA